MNIKLIKIKILSINFSITNLNKYKHKLLILKYFRN